MKIRGRGRDAGRIRPTVARAARLLTAAGIGLLGVAGASSAQMPPTGYAATVIADDPAGYWRLGEVDGPFADSSPSGTHPGSKTLVGGSNGSLFLRAQPGAVAGDDGAIHDDAAPSGFGHEPNGAFVHAPEVTPLGGRNPFSLEIWARPLPHDAADTFGQQFSGGMIGGFDMDGSGSFNYGVGVYLSWPTRELIFVRAGQGTGSDLLESPTLSSSIWSHVVATYDGETMRTYVDGALAGSVASTRDIGLTPPITRIGAFRFDFGVTEYPGYFYGSLDEAAVYNRALAPEEIAAHFQAGSESLLLTLTSDPPEIALGSYRTVSATFSGGTVPAGTAVDFAVSGANPTTGQAFTDEEGNAKFVYGAAVEGTDEIRALASISGETVEAIPLTVSAAVPPLPIVTESRYVTELRESRFRSFGTFAGESGASGPVVLSFGQPNAGGTTLVGERGFVRSYDRIVRVLQRFSNAYNIARHGPQGGRILIVVGVNNDMPSDWNDNLALASEAGADFARAVKRFKEWVAGPHTGVQGRTVSYTTQRVAAGIDMEQAYRPPRDTWSRYDVTKAFLDGYNSVAGHPRLLNYGALTIDPTCGNGTLSDPDCVYAGRGWSAQRVLQLSRPPYSTFICPQVYKEFQVDNWIALQHAAKRGELLPPPLSMYVKCLFNSDPPPGQTYYTPTQSWRAFWSQLASALRGDWTEQNATHTKTVAAS